MSPFFILHKDISNSNVDKLKNSLYIDIASISFTILTFLENYDRKISYSDLIKNFASVKEGLYFSDDKTRFEQKLNDILNSDPQGYITSTQMCEGLIGLSYLTQIHNLPGDIIDRLVELEQNIRTEINL